MPGGKENASSGAATSSKPAVSSGDSSRQLVAAAAAAQAMQQHAAPSLASDTAAPAASAASAAAVAGSRQQVAGDRHEAAASAAQPPEQQQQQGYGEESLRSGSPDPQPPASVPKLLPRRFASRSFYGSRLRLGCASARAQEVEERIREHLFATQINAVKRQKALDGEDAPPPAVWRTFPVQQPAFDLADSQPGLEVFSVEYGLEGKRRFLVTTRPELWRRYALEKPQYRHYYEIIRQGRPCHLYFDLEFAVADNPGLDGVAAVDALLALVRDALEEQFALQLQDEWVLELDSSTDAKFSRHLIIRVPGTAFASNAHVGAFVLQLCAQAKERRAQDARCALLVGQEEALFVDPAVYSRNRAFRLYLSSKAGKRAILDSTGRFGGSPALSKQELFSLSLITEVPPGARLLRCFKETAEEAAAATVARGRRTLSGTASAASGAPLLAAGGGASQVCYGPSPFPQLEAFISTICREGGVAGHVRSWLQLGDILVFNIRDNRWCGNVGRAHKSNGIFYVVDLQEGTWHQKCYDPECRHYRSPLTPLPPHLYGLLEQHQAQQTPAAADGGSSSGAWQEQGGWGPCGICGGSYSCCCETDDDSLLLQALDQFEGQQLTLQQQQQQQQAAHQQQQQQQQQQQRNSSQQQQQQPPPAPQHRRHSSQQTQQQKQQVPIEVEQAAEPPAAGDDSLLVQALDQFETAQQQQQQQQQPSIRQELQADQQQQQQQQVTQQQQHPQAPAELAEPPGDELFLKALLQYEQATATPPPAATAAPALAPAAGFLRGVFLRPPTPATAAAQKQQPKAAVTAPPQHRQQRKRPLEVWEKMLDV